MNKYIIIARGKRWNEEDEVVQIISDNPHNALTKARIKQKGNFLDRVYCVIENSEILGEYYSYGMIREIFKRKYGEKFYYWEQRKER